jgi:hypothetical protein
LPVYYRLNGQGGLDPSTKWPGWDGWYFFLIPDDDGFPLADELYTLKLVRCSIMTGLYGLEGIDNYRKLSRAGLNSFDAAEYLTLCPIDRTSNGRVQRENNLFQHYLPRGTDLAMNIGRLETAISAGEPDANAAEALYGKISGVWPDYTFYFAGRESRIKCSLRYHGDGIVWWADVPNVFTYFAAFGRLEGEVTLANPDREQAGASISGSQVHKIKGRGAFEHGFARKPFNYDFLWWPVKVLQKVVPSFNPVRYNYQLFIGDEPHLNGGFMQALGFGIPFRNRGGFYVDGDYTPIDSVAIQYLDDPAPDVVTLSGRPQKFYHRWIVKAETKTGPLEYVGSRQGPPPSVTGNMMYYYFTFEGSHRGKSIGGSGYAEYLIM